MYYLFAFPTQHHFICTYLQLHITNNITFTDFILSVEIEYRYHSYLHARNHLFTILSTQQKYQSTTLQYSRFLNFANSKHVFVIMLVVKIIVIFQTNSILIPYIKFYRLHNQEYVRKLDSFGVKVHHIVYSMKQE